MYKKTVINKLNKVFALINHKDKKYSEAWLTEMDFGGLYRSGGYRLNMRAEHKVEDYFQEISDIFDTLDREAKDTLEYVWTVKIHNPDDCVERQWDDIIVCSEELAVQGYVHI